MERFGEFIMGLGWLAFIVAVIAAALYGLWVAGWVVMNVAPPGFP